MSNEDLTQEELNRVNDALNALSQHKNQPTQSEWGNIMEEANKAKTLSSKRIKLLSAAASILVIAAIATTIVLTSDSDKKDNNTADKTKKETATTKPLSEEEKILRNSIVITESVTDNENGVKNSFKITDGATGKTLNTVSSGDYDVNALHILDSTDSEILFGRDSDCLVSAEKIYHIKSNTIEELDGEYRIYSPSGEKYLTYTPDVCVEETPDFAGYKWTLKKSNGDTIHTYKPAEKEFDTWVKDAQWIDEDKLLVEKEQSGIDGDMRVFEIIDTKKGFELSKTKSDLTLEDREESIEYIRDIKTEGSNIYLLIDGSGEGFIDVEVMELNSKSIVWHIAEDETATRDIFGDRGVIILLDLAFQKDTVTISGGLGIQNSSSNQIRNAFAFNSAKDVSYKFEGSLILPKP